MTSDYYSILAPFDFCVKFPQLEKLDIPDFYVSKIRGALDLTRGHPLKNLTIFGGDEIGVAFISLYSSFPYIEEFNPTMNLLFIIYSNTWVETLRKLELSVFPENTQLSHYNFKNLEELHCYAAGEHIFHLRIASLIEIHTQLPQLKHVHLTCRGISPEQINELQEWIPDQLRAILTIVIKE